MKGLLLLFYCLEILAALVCGADGNKDNATSLSTAQSSTSASTPPNVTTAESSEASSLTSTETPVSLPSSSRSSASTSVRPPKTTTVAPHWGMYRRECHVLYLVSGGFIIVCTVLLVSCLMLACKVRHLGRRLQALSGDTDLISNSEFWMGSARRNKSRSGPEAKESIVLMTDFSQTQEGDGANKEEGKKVDGQMGEEKKKKVEENGDESKKETPDTNKSLSSKPEEEPTDPKSSKADSSTEV